MANISVLPVDGYDQPDKRNVISAEQLKEEATGSLAAEIMAEMFRRMARKLVQAVDDDTEILLPRASEGNSTAISEWFSEYQDYLFAIVIKLFQEEAPDVSRFREKDARVFLIKNFWPFASNELGLHILHKMGVRWAARQYTDATVVQTPERAEYGWRLPLILSGSAKVLGQIALDKEGNIIKDHTTSRTKLREALLRAA